MRALLLPFLAFSLCLILATSRAEDTGNTIRKSSGSVADGQLPKPTVIVTTDQKVYTNVRIRRVAWDGLLITHADGAITIPFAKLPDDLRDAYQRLAPPPPLPPGAPAPPKAKPVVPKMADEERNVANLKRTKIGQPTPRETGAPTEATGNVLKELPVTSPDAVGTVRDGAIKTSATPTDTQARRPAPSPAPPLREQAADNVGGNGYSRFLVFGAVVLGIALLVRIRNLWRKAKMQEASKNYSISHPPGFKWLVKCCDVAGCRHRIREAQRFLANPGGIWLEREPQNAHDKNAIKVLGNGKHIGYVPADIAAVISKLPATTPLYAAVRSTYLSSSGFVRITIAIFGNTPQATTWVVDACEDIYDAKFADKESDGGG